MALSDEWPTGGQQAYGFRTEIKLKSEIPDSTVELSSEIEGMDSTFKGAKDKGVRVETLQPADFASWDELVNTSPHGTVFHYSWWLEATGYDFEILVCRDRRGRLLAGMPLPRKKRAGLILFHSPLLTPYLGPIFDLSKALNAREKLSIMRHLGESLARGIRGYDSLLYQIGSSGPDLQGFLWAGFRVELFYTFRFDAGISTDQILKGMSITQRRALNKAQRMQATVEVEDKVGALVETSKQTFLRQGLRLPYPEGLPGRLWAAAHSRGCADIYLSGTAADVLAAGLLVVHDARNSYGILAGTNPQTLGTGGSNLVVWHAIRDSMLAGRSTDFSGASRLRPIEHYYRRWGAVAKPTWILRKAGSLRGALAQGLLRWQQSRQQAQNSNHMGF